MQKVWKIRAARFSITVRVSCEYLPQQRVGNYWAVGWCNSCSPSSSNLQEQQVRYLPIFKCVWFAYDIRHCLNLFWLTDILLLLQWRCVPLQSDIGRQQMASKVTLQVWRPFNCHLIASVIQLLKFNKCVLQKSPTFCGTAEIFWCRFSKVVVTLSLIHNVVDVHSSAVSCMLLAVTVQLTFTALCTCMYKLNCCRNNKLDGFRFFL